MLAVISPAKSLDFDTPPTTTLATAPVFHEDAQLLIHKLRTISKRKLMKLMDISDDLAELNVQRYLQFEPGIPVERSKQAVLAFDGDVYVGMEAQAFSESDLAFAQDHLRILSGMYGILRPLDLIQPHRLEMGTSLPVRRSKNLYEFWRKRVTATLREAISECTGEQVLVNLASQEYFGVVDVKALGYRVVTPQFLDKKGASYKVVSFWAKKARGKMVAWIVANRPETVEELKSFQAWGYAFNADLSQGDQWAFTRDAPI